MGDKLEIFSLDFLGIRNPGIPPRNLAVILGDPAIQTVAEFGLLGVVERRRTACLDPGRPQFVAEIPEPQDLVHIVFVQHSPMGLQDMHPILYGAGGEGNIRAYDEITADRMFNDVVIGHVGSGAHTDTS